MESTPTLRDLFEQAVGLAPVERERLLAGAAPALRSELVRMLAVDAGAGEWLAAADAASVARAIGEPEDGVAPPPGSRIGPFELLDVLGEGGSSVVFHGCREVEGVRQHVAVKLLSRGVYTAEARRRFHHEREALARLRHPGIARLIEGGVLANGSAYIALELVEGEPVTRWADARALSERKRLTLFLQVCRAVESAHRALIVHRDLKPSNVLVNAEGGVKLVDFGIAKLLDDDGDATHTLQHALTPAYAAPEQLESGAVTTATDVYALGVLLRELLTGERPGMQRTRSAGGTCHAPPSRRRLHGDLGNIIAKATGAEPERRYGSAGALAEDIERHLDRQPVLAHPPSRWYRAGRFVARHRGGVAAGAAFMLALVASLSIALWQAGIARQQALRANATRDFLVSVFESAAATLPRDQRPTPDDLVKRAAADLIARDDLPDGLRVDMLLTLARVARSVGAEDQALGLLDHADSVAARLYASDDAPWWTAHVLRAALYAETGRYADAARVLRPLRVGLLARSDAIGVEGVQTLGDALAHTGQVDAGLKLLAYARAVATRANLPDARFAVSIAEAGALLDAEHFRAGLARADATFALWQARGARPDARVIALYEAIALGAEAAGDIPRAGDAYRKAIVLGDRFYDRPNPDQAWNVGMYGTFLIAQGRLAEAEPYAERAVDLRRKVFGDDSPETLYALAGMGKLRYAQGRWREATDWYGRGVASCTRTGLKELVCPRLLSLRSLAEGAAGDFGHAEADIRAALAMQASLGGEGDAHYAYPLEKLAVLQLREHRYKAAVATCDRVLAVYARVKGGMLQRALDTRLTRAQALFALGRTEDALREVQDIGPRYAALAPLGASRFAIEALAAQALAAAHRRGEAATAARRALALPRPAGSDPALVTRLQRLAALR